MAADPPSVTPRITPSGITSEQPEFSATRVAGTYLIAGLLWILLSDLTLSWLGGLTAANLLVSVAKGAAFVLLSTALMYWLCQREYFTTAKPASLLREVVEGTTDAVYVKDCDGRYLLINTAGAQRLGRTVSEVLGRTDAELFETEEAERLGARDQEIMAAGEAVTLEETVTFHGTSLTYQSTKAPYYRPDGKVAGLIGISRNITDRTKVEAALRETDAWLREAQRIARLGSWCWEPQNDRVWWSDALFELFGVDRAKVAPSFDAFLSLLHPEDRTIAINRVEAMLAGADEFADDLRILRPDGECMWLHSRGRATRDPSGAILLVEGTDQDVTSQRLAEAAVRESEMRLQAAVEVAGLGVIAIDYDRDVAELSPRAAEQFGLAAGTPVARSELHSRFHPEDRPDIARLTAGALISGSTGWFSLEHRVVRPDGTTRWLNVRKQVTFTADRPRRAVVVTVDVTERRQAEAQLREQEMLAREAAELAQVGGWGFNPATLESDWTPEVARIYGLSPDSPPTVTAALDFFSPEHRPALETVLAAAIRDGTPHDMELQLTSAKGEKKWVRTICRPIVEDGQVVRVRGSLQDITDRRQLEEQFRQAQKMEAVGRLAGGVAHDFNNILTVINGYSHLLLARHSVGDPEREMLTAINDAGQRATRLTQQLLAFSRKSMVEPRLVDVNQVVVDSIQLLRRLIGEDIVLEVLVSPTPVRVMIDPGQLEQVVMNLAVNSRDAMPSGGRLTIETSVVELGLSGDCTPECYAALRVADTGCGMTTEVRERIFEPFFTTKGAGNGTGLGLSVVHGVIEQAGGRVEVESTIGKGTTFTILLPATNATANQAPAGISHINSCGSETVLIAEDEDAVRALVHVSLELEGYTVLTASSSQDAIRQLSLHQGPIDLLITDVIMPGISGPELAEAARQARPSLQVLYMSGYADDALDRHGLQGATNHFLQKPFTPFNLARKVREILDQSSAPPAAHTLPGTGLTGEDRQEGSHQA